MDKTLPDLKSYSVIMNGYQTYKNQGWRTLYLNQRESSTASRRQQEKKDHIRRHDFQYTYLNNSDADGKCAKLNLSSQAIKIRTILQCKLDFLKEQISEIKFAKQKKDETKLINREKDNNASVIGVLNDLCAK